MSNKLPITCDYVFKRVFGQEDSKSSLKDFLESILDVNIEDIEINNTEIPKNYYDSKFGLLDLKVTLDNKMVVDVEVQMQNQLNIEQRMPYYMSATYANTLKQGEPYTNCKKTIVISILNFNYYKRNEYHSIARMKFEKPKPDEVVDMGYKKEDEYATEYLEMHIIELPKFKKKNPEMHTKISQWLYVFVGSDEQVEKAAKLNREIRKINKKLAAMSLNQEERNNYEFRLKAIRDEADALDRATKQGLEQGIERGVHENKKQMTKRMLRKNMKIEDIMDITGLTKEEIEKISKED